MQNLKQPKHTGLTVKIARILRVLAHIHMFDCQTRVFEDNLGLRLHTSSSRYESLSRVTETSRQEAGSGDICGCGFELFCR